MNKRHLIEIATGQLGLFCTIVLMFSVSGKKIWQVGPVRQFIGSSVSLSRILFCKCSKKRFREYDAVQEVADQQGSIVPQISFCTARLVSLQICPIYFSIVIAMPRSLFFTLAWQKLGPIQYWGNSKNSALAYSQIREIEIQPPM